MSASTKKEVNMLKQLQVDAGIANAPKPAVEDRLDWMYEFSSEKKDEETREQLLLGLRSVEDPADEDVKKLKKLETVVGSIFLKSATQTNEDTLRKLREDPLFTMKKAEMEKKLDYLQNPLVVEEVKKKKEKLLK
eukprot:Filipodium_phascolosomae@DN7157_c0_g1_i1.p1